MYPWVRHACMRDCCIVLRWLSLEGIGGEYLDTLHILPSSLLRPSYGQANDSKTVYRHSSLCVEGVYRVADSSAELSSEHIRLI